MATSYPSLVAAALAADKPSLTTNATGIIAVHECVYRKPWGVYFTEQTRTNVAYGDMYSFSLLFLGPMVVTGRYIVATLEAKVDAGTGYWQVVDADDADTLVSDEVEVTANAYEDSTATITVPAAWSAYTGSRRALAIQGKATATDTIYLRSSGYITWHYTD